MSEQVKISLEKLTTGRRVNKPLPALPPAAGIAAAEGFAPPQTQAAAGPGGGFASPLTEEIGLREYHPAQDVYDEDGTLVKIHPIKKLVMIDADGNQEVRNFGLPDYSSIV